MYELSSCRAIPLGKGDRQILVDERDYEWLSETKWYAQSSGGNVYARGYKLGSAILMHRAIFGYHSTESYTQISHHNGNTLDNRFDNLKLRGCRSVRANRFHASNKVQTQIRGALAKGRWLNRGTVDAISADGIVLKSNIAASINNANTEVEALLCQRLKAVQLLIESKNQLANCGCYLDSLRCEIKEAMDWLNLTINSLQPK